MFESSFLSRIKRMGVYLFFEELFSHPEWVGAAWPSSSRLALNMSRHVPVGKGGLVVELGGGTGVITRGLLQRGILPQHLLVIERSIKLVMHLQAEFPTVLIYQDEASNLSKVVKSRNAVVDAVVSSLPLRSLPTSVVCEVTREVEQVLPVGGLFIQYTYHLTKSLSLLSDKFQLIHSEIIWLNVPPARVDVFKRCQ